MKRPTIRDIANEAGVSPGAVSFALNGRPGVSEETRARILEVASRLGWQPSVAALALSGRRARALGLVIARPIASVASESFFLQFIAGIEGVLNAQALALVLQLVETIDDEMAIYKRWWSERRVDGVLLTDPRAEDPRPPLLAELGIPAVVVGGTQHGPQLASVVTDDSSAMRSVVKHLTDQGHRYLAHVSGFGGLLHTDRRTVAFRESAERAGAQVVAAPTTDFTEEAGRHVTESLLAAEHRPTAIIYDNEILALGGMSAVLAAKLSIPDEVAIISWEDSPVCRVVQPPLTALRRDPAELGEKSTKLLCQLVAGEPSGDIVEMVPELIVRQSSVRKTT